MLFAIQDLQFTLGSLLLEGYPAFGARCACAGLLLAAGLLLRHWLQKWLFPHLARLPLPSHAVGILVGSFARPAAWFAALTGLYLALASLPWAAAAARPFLLKLYRVAVILLLSWGLYGASELTGLLLAGAREEVRTNKTLRSVLVKVYKVVVIVLGGLMAAQELGLPVTGILTSAGLVGLTLSLAAQDTASNLFAGMMILVERPFQIGDWVVIGSVEGSVEDITFRSTKVRALDNSLYILTNSDVCAATINNGTQRTKRLYRLHLRGLGGGGGERVRRVQHRPAGVGLCAHPRRQHLLPDAQRSEPGPDGHRPGRRAGLRLPVHQRVYQGRRGRN